LAVGQELRIGAAYAPARGGAAPGQIEALSDGDVPRKLVTLAGQGIAPRLCIDGKDLDFGGVDVGKSASHSAQLTNCGLLPLRIDTIATQAPFKVTPPALPQTLQPGASVALPLVFSP